MSKEDIIRAWKDEEYRNSLSEEQRSQDKSEIENIVSLDHLSRVVIKELTDNTAAVISGGCKNIYECPGPKKLPPSAHRNYDPIKAARTAGILGVMAKMKKSKE